MVHASGQYVSFLCPMRGCAGAFVSVSPNPVAYRSSFLLIVFYYSCLSYFFSCAFLLDLDGFHVCAMIGIVYSPVRPFMVQSSSSSSSNVYSFCIKAMP
jgi:hypothetical protein